MGKRKKKQRRVIESFDFMPDFIAYTDGSCNNLSPYGEGGAAYVLLDSSENLVAKNSKGFINTTNNHMELIAILSAVASAPAGASLLVRTDSEYCITMLSNPTNSEIKMSRPNAQVIRNYFRYAARLGEVRFEWVKGHDGIYYNELCDQMAEAEREAIRVSHNIPVYDWKNSPKVKNKHYKRYTV